MPTNWGLATPCNLSTREIEKVAEAAARAFGYKSTTDLVDLVQKKLFGRIEVVDSLNALVGALQVRKDGHFTIFLPDFTSELKDRFTIAHELGHWILHADMGQRPIEVKRGGDDLGEREADVFATAFLMNASKFKRLKDKGLSDIQLAQEFNVALDDVAFRHALLEASQ